MPATWESDAQTDEERGLARKQPVAPRSFMNRADRRRLARTAGKSKSKRRRKTG